MIAHRCRRCTWWDNRHPSVLQIPIELCKTEPGFCRKHKPGAVQIQHWYFGVQPVMDGDEFCGEFREEQG